jgi:hypothetical protein
MAVVARSAAWLLLAIPSLLFCYTLTASIARGRPTTSPELVQRLKQILTDVGASDDFAVIVQDQTASPCSFRRRRGRVPLLIASLAFVHDASDELLRGVAALQYAELRDAQLAKRATRWQVMCGWTDG